VRAIIVPVERRPHVQNERRRKRRESTGPPKIGPKRACAYQDGQQCQSFGSASLRNIFSLSRKMLILDCPAASY
jgi:hypothetical protein